MGFCCGPGHRKCSGRSAARYRRTAAPPYMDPKRSRGMDCAPFARLHGGNARRLPRPRRPGPSENSFVNAASSPHVGKPAGCMFVDAR